VISGFGRPADIVVDDEKISIRATALWGKSVRETAAHLRAKLGSSGWDFANIGSAGENLVRFAW
jgi:aldehyde:ferredoxin oxidoreductase